MSEFDKKVITIQHKGREIYGVLYMPKIEGRCPLVIFSHGYNGRNEDFTMNCEHLATKGIAAYSFDFCGGSVNSKSSLKTTEMTLFTEKEDLCAIIETLKNNAMIDNKNIFLFGGSQGGLVSTMVAEEMSADIRGMLLLFPAMCIADNWQERFPNYEDIPDTQELWGMTLGRVFFESIHDYDTWSNVGKFKKNVLIFIGDQDPIVSLGYGQKTLEAYENAKMEIFKGEGHGFTKDGNATVADMTYEFVVNNINKE
jgi:hypothetical protein